MLFWYNKYMEKFINHNNIEGEDIKLSPREEMFEEYERLQVQLISEEDLQKREEIESKLNELAEELGIEEGVE